MSIFRVIVELFGCENEFIIVASVVRVDFGLSFYEKRCISYQRSTLPLSPAGALSGLTQKRYALAAEISTDLP